MVGYKLTKRHIACYDQSRPILISDTDAMGAGPYDRAAVLPFSNGATAEAIVLRALAKSRLSTDPTLVVDERESFRDYCLQYLGIRPDEIERARWITKIFDTETK